MSQCQPLNKDTVNLVIYHGKCADGFGSALSVWLYFKAHFNSLNASGEPIEYFAASFEAPPPDTTGKNVLICDFTYKMPITKQIMERANSLLIIDHHKTGRDNLAEVPDQYKIFDMDHSGAALTWTYFFPVTPAPLLIQYIEDNDMWWKRLPDTREITSYIFTLPFEFERYAELIDSVADAEAVDGTYIRNVVVPTAIGMMKQNQHYIEQAIKYGTMKFMQIGDTYYHVVFNNSSVLKSEIGNQILGKYPTADFSCIYSVTDGQNYLSLRSMDDRADVSAVAQRYGGGGHMAASGCTTYGPNIIPSKILSDHSIDGLLKNSYYGKFNNLNIVYLNSYNLKKHVAKYLLQIRAHGKLSPKHQTCYALNTNPNKTPTWYDLSCVWNYDGQSDQTWFTVSWNSDRTYKDLQAYLLDPKISASLPTDKRHAEQAKQSVESMNDATQQKIRSYFSQEANLDINESDNTLHFSRMGLHGTL